MLMSKLLAGMPDLCDRVLATHVRDRHGRCRECSGVQWPCQVQQIAQEAHRLGRPRRRRTTHAPARTLAAAPSLGARHGRVA